jgi:hypothetical protein
MDKIYSVAIPGKSSTLNTKNPSTGRLESTTATISDAIILTKKLGMKYLWVDQLCIDQLDEVDKLLQINQMDAIYQGAEITIVAAAGTDQNFGLPGIGSKTRRAQPVATVGDFKLISTMAHPHDVIPKLTWSTRGWTYQEGVLSRRRLLLMDDQAYFECNGIYCYESLSLNIFGQSNLGNGLLTSGIFSGDYGRLYPDIQSSAGYSPDLRRYFLHVEAFSAKNLSNENDSLRAFLGIAKYFETVENPIHHLWGIPFRIPNHSEVEGDVEPNYLSIDSISASLPGRKE